MYGKYSLKSRCCRIIQIMEEEMEDTSHQMISDIININVDWTKKRLRGRRKLNTEEAIISRDLCFALDLFQCQRDQDMFVEIVLDSSFTLSHELSLEIPLARSLTIARIECSLSILNGVSTSNYLLKALRSWFKDKTRIVTLNDVFGIPLNSMI